MTKVKYKENAKRARLFYKSINWAEWWDEFLFTIKDNGSPKYPTAWSFAKAKGKNDFEQKVIYRAIGPEAQPPDKQIDLNCPWQGNWVQRRAKGFWVDQEGSKAEILRKAIEDKTDNLEILKQFTNVPVRFLTQYERIANQIVEHFGGRAVVSTLSSNNNLRRAKTLLYLLDRCRQGASRSIDDLAKCLGLHPDAPDKWADLAILSAEQAASAALRGQQQGLQQGGQVAAGYIGTVTKLVSMMVNKSQNYDLPLPEADSEDAEVPKHGKNGTKNGAKVH